MFRGTRLELLSVAVLPLGLGLAVHGAPEPTVDAAATQAMVGDVSFSGQIAPMFAESCVGCHGAETQEAGLRLDTYENVMSGSEYGPVIEAGSPEGSLLLDMISAGEMPQEDDAWDEDAVELVRDWISEGAADN